MSINRELHQTELKKVTKNLIKKAVILCYRDGITSSAPLGCGGDDILIHGEVKNGRTSVIKIRNYCGNSELLITDTEGHFLFYGRYDINLGIDFVIDHYWNIIEELRPIINVTLKQNKVIGNISIPENEYDTEGLHALRSLFPSII